MSYNLALICFYFSFSSLIGSGLAGILAEPWAGGLVEEPETLLLDFLLDDDEEPELPIINS